MAEEDEIIAKELVRHGVRTPIIAEATGVSSAMIRKYYKQLTGGESPSGPSRSPQCYSETWQQHAHVCLFVDIYHGMYGDLIFQKDDPAQILLRVCRAHENYILTHVHTNQPALPIDANLAYDLARLVIKREIVLRRCSLPECGFPAVAIAEQTKPMACPLCFSPLR